MCGTCPRVGRAVSGIVLLVGLVCEASAQAVGPGASPGRASYRPSSQWNAGPFFTAPHWDPYRPHAAIDTTLITSDPNAPPYSTAPHGKYSTYYPDRGALYPFAEGFSPYSGFAPWYEKTYGVEGTREQIERARVLFFRSAPTPPPGVLPPLPPSRLVAISSAPSQPSPRQAGTPFKVVVPGPATALPPGQVPVYRGNVAGTP
jgi:hypothetical protein